MLNLQSIPTYSGVYLMKDKNHQIIYIGKAKNLKHRVSSYFQKSHHDIKTELLVQKIADISFITTNNEKEALILENQLIKKYLPHYNILLKDHKSYLRISIDYNYRFPRIHTTREKSRKKVRYFGPFPSSSNAKALIDIGEKFFQLRQCNLKIPKQELLSEKTKPCFLYHLKICPAACIGLDKEDNYKARLKQYINFLQGNFSKTNKEISIQMKAASDSMNYEEAARLRDLITALEEITNQQKIYFESSEIIDIWGVFQENSKYSFVSLRFTYGVLEQKKVFHISSPLPIADIFETVSNKVYIFDSLTEEKREEEVSILEEEILNLVHNTPVIQKLPHKIVIPFNLDNKGDLESSLLDILNWPLIVLDNPPQDFSTLLNMARENALAEWKSFYKVTHSEAALLELKSLLKLEKLPFRIETFDISNIGDSFAVGSCVVFTDGSPYKQDYRYFKMKYTPTQNDFAMMQETLLRRLKGSHILPDLIVVDGGKGQVSAAQELLDDMGLSIPLIGLAKKEELIIIPKQKDPIKIPHNHPALRLLIATRDEAHRFANKLRASMFHKKTLESAWDKIPGIGNKKSTVLKQSFSTPTELIKTPLEEIQKQTGFSAKEIQKLIEHIQK